MMEFSKQYPQPAGTRPRAETPQGSLPACASGDVATRIRSITDRHSLFPTPLPAPPLGSLTAFLPAKQERYGLTTFRKVDTNGVGALCSPGALAAQRWCG